MSYTELPDIDIWARFKKGDIDAFSFIYSRYAEVLYKYGLKFTSQTFLIEDSIQDLFTELIKNRKNLSETDNILFYLLRSYKRKLFRNLEKEKQKQKGIAEENIPFEIHYSAEQLLINEETSAHKARMLARALLNLSPRQKEAIYLKFTKELKYAEISGIMDISVESCHNLVSDAIKRLKEAIKMGGGDDASGLFLSYLI